MSAHTTLSAQIKKAIATEELRKQLLMAKKFKKLLQTYRTQKAFLPDENTGDFWDEKFAGTVDVFPMERWRIQRVVSQLDCKRSILNLGVGRGALEHVLLEKCSTPNYLGTDITRRTIRQLRQKFPMLAFRQGDLLSLSPKKLQFDQILLLEVLEHIKPNETFPLLKHIFALLTPGGKFYVSVPVNEGLEQMLPVNPNSHMRLYSEELLRFELETVGFRVEKVLRASAFASRFRLKHWANMLLHKWEPNNLVFVCSIQKAPICSLKPLKSG